MASKNVVVNIQFFQIKIEIYLTSNVNAKNNTIFTN
jgi:hypothetical protein